MSKRYSLVNDPLYYVTVVLFALLTTGLPALIGQPIFMPIAQTLALFTFLIIPLRQGFIRQTVLVMALWLFIQFIVILLATLWAEQRVQVAFANGFLYRMAYVNWFYEAGGALRPDGFSVRPLARSLELLGVTLGSLFTLGLVGIWFLVRALNLAAFSMGALMLSIGEPQAVIGALPLWSLVRIAGYAGLVILLAEPLLTSNWNPVFYLRERRRLLLTAVTLLLVGLMLEFFLPNFWRTLFR
ncbi:MAG: hypothetical protein KDE19_01780 [Caldilineaceae bacterium]|nr:hypothetical protein [Caldilineaceae bacterium]